MTESAVMELANQVLTKDDRDRLYEWAGRHGLSVHRQRFEALLRQPILFDDDVIELRRLAAQLGVDVVIARDELEVA